MKRRDFMSALAVTPVAAAAAGQERAPAPAAARPLTLTLLGTGTPAPSRTRQSSGYLIEVGADLIVWDHGPGRASASHRERVSIDRHDACLLHAPALRPLHGVRAAGAAALGSRGRSHRGPAGLWPTADCADDRTAVRSQIDLPGIREQIVHEIQGVFSGRVIWGEDLMRLNLAGARVSAIEPRTGE
jgi:hypothetical protein